MTSEKWRKVEELFLRAVETDPSQVALLLDEISPDDSEVRSAVERLLKDEQNSFLRTITMFHRPAAPEARSSSQVFANGSVVADRYRILLFLGAGGMGEVYEAEDLTLGQSVALKTILPQAAEQIRSLKRFKQETALARKVTHPNVCRVFDVGVHHESNREFLFLTMELLSGETLAERIRRTGRLGPEEALPLIRQMAEALAAAHSAEVVHGDFKPGNVMLAPGRNGQVRAVVMDFGLARSLTEGTEALETRSMPETVAGTPPYMAPELFTGAPASARTDIYALGIVLFEMMAGTRPFRGNSPLEELLKRALEKAPSVRQFVPELAAQWEDVIARCIDPTPESRFSDARQISEALEEIDQPAAVAPFRKVPWRRAALAAGLLAVLLPLVPSVRQEVVAWIPWTNSLPDQKRLVVIPFENVGRDASLQALCDGLVETLTGYLSTMNVEKLAVVPASDVFKDGITSIPEARNRFRANLAITGSVERGPGGIRLTLKLIDATTLQQIDSAVLNDRSGDFHHLQDTALRKLAELLRIGKEQAPKIAIGPANVQSPAAYELYLKAVGYLQRWDKDENLTAAIDLLEQCVRQDQQFALGYARLADAYRMKFEFEKGGLWLDSALENAKRAAQLNPNLAAVQVSLGKVYSAIGEHELAIDALQRALKLDAHSSDAHGASAGLYERSGDHEKAEEAYKRALALQPDTWRPRGSLAQFYFRRQRYPDAIREWRKVLELTPDNMVAYVNLGACLSHSGQAAEARSMYEKAISIKPNYTAYMNLGTMDSWEGKYADAAKRYEKALELNDKDYMLWGNLASAYWWAPGTREKAVPAFERAAEMARATLKLKPRDPYLHSDLAIYYAKLRKPDLAAARIESALALAPADKEILVLAAEAYEIIGRRARAVELARKALESVYPLENLERNPEFRDLLKELRVKGKP